MKKTEIGISVYPDFYDKKELEQQILRAAKLEYKRCFTSIQLGNLGFNNTKSSKAPDFQYLFDLCDSHGFIVHVDINDHVLRELGGSPNDLSIIAQMKIKVLRLDGGFSDDEVALMTTNPYNVRIEDNTSMVHDPCSRLEIIKQKGNLKQYIACHNFFPRNDTGLSFDNTVYLASLYAAYGVKNGVFIASLASPSDLNVSGNGVPTVERHRYTPPHIAFSELRNTGIFDYILFGDSVPDYNELLAVAQIASKDYVEIPIWLDKNISSKVRKLVLETKMLSRPDQAEYMIRATQTRGSIGLKPHHTIYRPEGTITIDNMLSNRYEGEIQIALKDLPPSPIANVIGQVKPYGMRLVKQIESQSLPFKLIEE